MTGNELKERRRQLGIRQEDLARELEVVVSSVARWEQLKDEEIPNSKMLHLALLSMEIPKFYVLEYSVKGQGFHIQSVADMVTQNRRAILDNKSTDFVVIGISPDSEKMMELSKVFGAELDKKLAGSSPKKK